MYIGVNLPSKQNVPTSAALEHGYDFITSRITTSVYRRKIQALVASSSSVPRVPFPFEDDLALDPANNIGQTIALASPWAEIDAKEPHMAETNIKVLLHEVEYAQFCGVTVVVVPGPRRRTHISRYSHAISQILLKAPKITILVHTTLTEEYTEKGAPPADYLSTWNVWESVYTLCGRPANLKLALEVPAHTLPSYVIERWTCEPVMMLVLSGAGVFVPNAKNYPVLPRNVQSLVHRFFDAQSPFILLKEVKCNDDAHMAYLRHLESKIAPTLMQVYAKGMENVLQVPLQPQGCNLESSTYEVFEKDGVKYQRYQAAITASLIKLDLKEATVFVVGAGRGALVDRVLISAKELQVSVVVHAVEKNPSAVAYLKNNQRTKWGDRVKVHMADTRNWVAPHRADIIVSEMLGSFGDNELAPEALQSMKSVLEPHGMMIPAKHTSWAAPVFNPSLHAKTAGPGYEQPYVVYSTQAQLLSDPQPIWTFSYPTKPGLDRTARVVFVVKHAGTLHGFSGYFETSLFSDVEMCILPGFKNCPISWFPMWFPLKTPLVVGDGNEVELTMWRTSDGTQVYYEWSAEVFRHENNKRWKLGGGEIHNAGGRAVKWM